MINSLRSIVKSDFAISSFYSAIGTFVKMCTALLLSKIIALQLGVQGLGLIGQFSNFVSIALFISGGALNIGIVKYVAEFSKDPVNLNSFINTSFTLVLCMGGITGVFLLSFASFWSDLVLRSTLFTPVFQLFGTTILFYSLNTYFLSVINGFKEIKLFNQINIVTSIAGLILSFFLIKALSLKGALYSVVLNQSLIFFLTFFFIRKRGVLNSKHLSPKINADHLKRISKFILMAATSIAFAPVIQLLLRNYIIDNLGLESAGIWEAVNRISNFHLLFITTTLSTYYLPKLSECKTVFSLRYEIYKVLKIIVPMVALSSFLIYLLRFIVLNVLFTSEFNQANVLFPWQLVGDVLKVASWIIGFQMHAKAMTKLFIISEILGGTSYIITSMVFIQYWGLPGTSMAYALNYGLYLIALLIIFRKTLFPK